MPRNPYRFTDEVQRIILASLRKGLPIKHALGLAKVAPMTFYRWQRAARRGDERFTEFFAKVDQAKGASALQLVNVITEAALEGGDVKAAQWLLTYVHGIGPTGGGVSVNINQGNGGAAAIEVDGAALGEDEIETLRRLPTEQLDDLYKRLTTFEDPDVIDAEE